MEGQMGEMMKMLKQMLEQIMGGGAGQANKLAGSSPAQETETDKITKLSTIPQRTIAGLNQMTMDLMAARSGPRGGMF